MLVELQFVMAKCSVAEKVNGVRLTRKQRGENFDGFRPFFGNAGVGEILGTDIGSHEAKKEREGQEGA